MICMMDTLKKVLPSPEKKEKREEQLENVRENETAHREKNKVQEAGDDTHEVEEDKSKVADKIKSHIPLAFQPHDYKKIESLNLNNEVVKMRKEVKRVRALIIRRLTRQIMALRKKKGTDTEIERNQRRAARLLEEIHAMKVMAPDRVTKTALLKSPNFEQLCKNPKSTISDRAIARIATHPQFSKRIEDIKAALNAFRGERTKAGKHHPIVTGQNKVINKTPDSPGSMRDRNTKKKEERTTVEQKEIVKTEKEGSAIKGTKNVRFENKTSEATNSATTSHAHWWPEVRGNKKVGPPSLEILEKQIVKNTTQGKDAERTYSRNSAPVVPQKKKDEEESDCELLDGDEKEYFDDSTEERFHKQSSDSEVSDDDDQFFLGKVSKKKKKKKKLHGHGEVKADTTHHGKKELEVVESQLKAKASVFKSVFCSLRSAAHPNVKSAARVSGRDKFRSQKVCGNNKPSSSHSEPHLRGFISASRQKGRGLSVRKQMVHSDGVVFHHQEALHPSWEASKKRKEQQGQILAFQGKKIKFDD